MDATAPWGHRQMRDDISCFNTSTDSQSQHPERRRLRHRKLVSGLRWHIKTFQGGQRGLRGAHRNLNDIWGGWIQTGSYKPSTKENKRGEEVGSFSQSQLMLLVLTTSITQLCDTSGNLIPLTISNQFLPVDTVAKKYLKVGVSQCNLFTSDATQIQCDISRDGVTFSSICSSSWVNVWS